MNIEAPSLYSFSRNCVHKEQSYRSLELCSLVGITWAKEVLLTHVAPIFSLLKASVEDKTIDLELFK